MKAAGLFFVTALFLKALAGEVYEVPLEKVGVSQYKAKLYVSINEPPKGNTRATLNQAPHQAFWVLIDTGSKYVGIPTTGSTGCDDTLCPSGVLQIPSDKLGKDIHFGYGGKTGKRTKGKATEAYLSFATTEGNMPFVKHEIGVLQEGSVKPIVGMIAEEKGELPGLMTGLFRKKIIDPRFSLLLCPDSDNSMLYLGGVDKKAASLPKKTLPYIGRDSVSVPDEIDVIFQGGRTTPVSIVKEDTEGAKEILIDSGSPMLHIPEEYYQQIAKAITENLRTKGFRVREEFLQNRHAIRADAGDFPVLRYKWNTQNVYMDIQPQDYLVYTERGTIRGVKIKPTKRWVLGDPFYYNYYVDFDYGGNKVNFYSSETLCQ